MDLSELVEALNSTTTALDNVFILKRRSEVFRSFLSAVSIFLRNEHELFNQQRLSVRTAKSGVKKDKLFIEDDAKLVSQLHRNLMEIYKIASCFMADPEQMVNVESFRKSRKLFPEELKVHVLKRCWTLFNNDKVRDEFDRLANEFYNLFAANLPFKGIHESFAKSFKSFPEEYKKLQTAENAIEEEETLEAEKKFSLETLIDFFPEQPVFKAFYDLYSSSKRKSGQALKNLDETLEDCLRAETKNLLQETENLVLQNIELQMYDLKDLSLKKHGRKGSQSNGKFGEHVKVGFLSNKSQVEPQAVCVKYVRTNDIQRHKNAISGLFLFLHELALVNSHAEMKNYLLNPIGYSLMPNSRNEKHDAFALVYDNNGAHQTLSEVRDSGYKFNEVEILSVFLNVAKALVALHKEGIVHGNITSKNIVLTVETNDNNSRAVIKLGDFVDDESEKYKETEKDDSFEADIFALGSIILELLKAEPSSKKRPAVALTNFVLDKRMKKSIADIVNKCLQEDGYLRYSADKLKVKLEELMKIFKLDPAHLSAAIMGLLENKHAGENKQYTRLFREKMSESAKNRRSLKNAFRRSKVFADAVVNSFSGSKINDEKSQNAERSKMLKQDSKDMMIRRSVNLLNRLRNKLRQNYKKSSIATQSTAASNNSGKDVKTKLSRSRSNNFEEDEMEFQRSTEKLNPVFKSSLDKFEDLANEDGEFEEVDLERYGASGYDSDTESFIENQQQEVDKDVERERDILSSDRQMPTDLLHEGDMLFNTKLYNSDTKKVSLDLDVLEDEDYDIGVMRKRSNAVLMLC